MLKELVLIQKELKAPKNQRNNFGKYNYRSCEDILEALKPVLSKHKCYLTLSDDIREIAGILYVEATAVIVNSEGEKTFVKASAGVDTNRKGMDLSQTFGSSSSYARKYALNGLFCIDDTKDADTQDNTQNNSQENKNKNNFVVKEEFTEVLMEKTINAFKKLGVSERDIRYQNILKKYNNGAKVVEEIKNKLSV